MLVESGDFARVAVSHAPRHLWLHESIVCARMALCSRHVSLWSRNDLKPTQDWVGSREILLFRRMKGVLSMLVYALYILLATFSIRFRWGSRSMRCSALSVQQQCKLRPLTKFAKSGLQRNHFSCASCKPGFMSSQSHGSFLRLRR